MHRLQELVRRHRQGCCGREVARLLGMRPNTELKYREALKAEGLLFGDEALPDLETLRLAVESQVERSSLPEKEISVPPPRKRFMQRLDSMM